MKTNVLLAFVVCLLLNMPAYAQTGKITLNTSADAMVEGGTSGDKNYGAETFIRSKKASTASSSTFNRYSYLKFDLSGINKQFINSAKLRLYCSLLTNSGFSIDLFETASNWSEGTISWNNRPALGSPLLAFTAPNAVNSWNEIMITNSIKSYSTNSASYAAYVTAVHSTNQIGWNSKEAGSGKPYLEIVFKAVKPLSASASVISNNQIDLTWDTTGCNADKYLIERKLSLIGNFVPLATLDAPLKALYQDTEIDNQQSYTYRITALNTGGVNASPIEASTIGTKPMEYVGSTSAHPTLDPVDLSSSDNPILRLEVETTGPASPQTLKSIEFNLEGTTKITDLASINIYYTGSSPNFAASKRFSPESISVISGNITVVGEQILTEGKNYFWISQNIQPTATPGNAVDARCTSLTLEGSTTLAYIPSVTDPVGSRTISSTFVPVLTKLEESIIDTTVFANTNLVSFSQDVICSYKGYQYAAYWATNKRIAVARKMISGGNWEVIVLNDYVSNNNLTDNHYNVSMGLCHTDGTIHLSFDMHAQNLKYRKSIKGLIDTPQNFQWTNALFEPTRNYLVANTVVTQVTYPRFITKPDGGLLFEARLGSSGNGDSYLWEYNGVTEAWTSVGMYINGRSDNHNAYLHGIEYDKFGKLHAAWCWRETSQPQTNNSLCYAYSEDHGRTWKNTKGVHIATAGSGSTAIRSSSPDVTVWAIPQNRGLMNQESMCIDNKGRVHVLNRYIKDSDPDVAVWGTSYPVHFYRDEAGVWHRDFMLQQPEGARRKIVSDANNNIYLVLTNNIYAATEASAWTDWKVVAQKGSGSFWGEGAVDRRRCLEENVLSIGVGRPNNVFYDFNYLIDNTSEGTGSGLTTEYFNSLEFKKNVFASQDSVNFSWGRTPPGPDVNADTCTVRLNGLLQTRYSEQYKLYLSASEKVRCWINGELMVDGWDNESTREFQVLLPLLPDHNYHIKIETAFTDKPKQLKLEWESKRQPRIVVPLAALYNGERTAQGSIFSSYSSSCSGSPVRLTLKGADGAIQWMSSLDNQNWASIAKSEGSSVLDTSLSLSFTYYRAAVSDGKKVLYSEPIMVQASPRPVTPTVELVDGHLRSSAAIGNQWLFNNQPILEANRADHVPSRSGRYSTIVNNQGCLSDTSNIVDFVLEGLPVSLVSFKGAGRLCQVYLTWKVANERYLKYYEVLFSSSGKKFKPVGRVTAINSPLERTYDYEPDHGDGYYKLRMVDNSNTYRETGIIYLSSDCKKRGIVLYPNPTDGNLHISGLNGDNSIFIYDMQGKLIFSLSVREPNPTLNLNSVSPGAYMVYASKEGVSSFLGKIIKK